jgi:hypothetical protein
MPRRSAHVVGVICMSPALPVVPLRPDAALLEPLGVVDVRGMARPLSVGGTLLGEPLRSLLRPWILFGGWFILEIAVRLLLIQRVRSGCLCRGHA